MNLDRTPHVPRRRSILETCGGYCLVVWFFLERGLVLAGVVTLVYYAICVVDLLFPTRETTSSYVVTPKVPRGGTLIVHRAYCIRRAAPSYVTRTFSDHGLYFTPTVLREPEPVGCYDKDFPIDLPWGLLPGHYTYQVTMTYQINRLFNDTITLPPLDFEITGDTMPPPPGSRS